MNGLNPNQAASADYLLDVRHLKKYFPIKGGIIQHTTGSVKAVDDVSFSIREGETLGVVGESGSGKSTLGRVILRLLSATDGQITFAGKDITVLKEKELRSIRKDMQIIFQDPFSSLNSKMSVQELIEETLIIQTSLPKAERKRKVEAIVEKVGLRTADLQKYPHEFSGGQRQRISIARALVNNPKFVVCDEPVSALDVSIQAQVLNLMMDLQDELGLTYLFIAHDLSVVKHISDRIVVMYLGNIVEIAPKSNLYDDPKHPYTQALLDSVSVVDRGDSPKHIREKIVLKGTMPSPADPPSGCVFRTRCPFAFDRCVTEKPQLTELSEGHLAACHLNTEPSAELQTLNQSGKEVSRL